MQAHLTRRPQETKFPAAEVDNTSSVALNVDTGAGGTVEGKQGRTYKTATGELVQEQGTYAIRCMDAWGNVVKMT
eukprot:4684806-Amphidinium_carterae.3